MENFKYKFLLLCFLASQTVFARAVEATLNKVGQRGQKILFAALPIFVLQVAYYYKRGKSEAKEKGESLVIGGILATVAFSLAYIFGR